jgi:hypothetical protein
MISPDGLLLVVPLFPAPVSVLLVGLAKEYITELGREQYFRRVTYWAPLEMLLAPNFVKSEFHLDFFIFLFLVL